MNQRSANFQVWKIKFQKRSEIKNLIKKYFSSHQLTNRRFCNYFQLYSAYSFSHLSLDHASVCVYARNSAQTECWIGALGLKIYATIAAGAHFGNYSEIEAAAVESSSAASKSAGKQEWCDNRARVTAGGVSAKFCDLSMCGK